MPSTLPVDLAERVFASHPAPLAEAVWALETASTVDEQRECLGMVARTLLRLASATVLAARLQRGATAVGDSRRTRELIDGWRTGLLTDGQWLELIREVLRSPPPDFPLPGLIEVTQGSQGARFVMALKQLLALGPSAPLEEPLAQLAWLLERMDGVWSKIHLVVPEAAPAEADARQSVHDLTGVADANPFTGRELASHVRLPVDRPVLCTSDGKPLLALHPVAQWLRDIPGCGDGLFFLDGCEPADEVLHAYPSLVEHRVPRAQGHVPLPDTAKAKAAARRLKIAVATAALIVLCAGAWQYQRGWSRRAAESARLEAVRRTEEADRTAEAAFRAQTAQAIARTQDSVQHRITAPQYTTWQQGTILRLAETLDHADTPSIRNELLEARSKDRPVAWRSLAGTALGFSPDGMSVLLSDKGALNVVGTSDLALRRTLPGGAPEDALPVPHSSAALLSEAGRVCLAQLESAEPCKPLIEATVHVWAVAPDGTSFATGGGDASIQLRSLKDGKVLKALEGHRGRVTALAFAPGGKTLLSAGDDGLVLVWDLARGKERHRLGHSGDPAVSTMALSPNGRTLATVSADRQLRVWNVNSDSDARSFKLPEIPRELRFLPDGQTLLYAVGKEIVAFDTGTGQTTGRLEGPASPIARVLLSENGRWLLATGENQATRLWDLTPPPRSLQLEVASPDSLAFAPDGASIATANGDVIRWTTQGAGTRLAPNLPTAQLTFHGVAFSPDGQRLVTGDAACSLWLWQSGHPVQQWKKSGACESPAGAVVFSPGGLRLAQVAGGTVTLWDAEKGTELWTRTTRHAVRAVSFSPDGSLLAVSDGEVTIWKVATAREGRPLTASKSIDALAFSPDGRLVLASASEVSFWDTATGRRTDAFQANEDGVTSLVFSPRGESLFGAGAKGVWWWDTATRHLRGRVPDAPPSVKSLAISPDGRTLAAGRRLVWLPEAFGPESKTPMARRDAMTTVSYALNGEVLAVAGADKTLRLLDAHTGAEVRRFKGHADAVLALAFAPDGKTLASGGADKAVRLWSLRDGEELRTIETPGKAIDVAFVEQGRQLVAAVGSSILLWDVATGEKLRELEGHTAPIVSLAVAESTHALASASRDGTVKLWDAESGEQSSELQAPSGSVTRVAFSQDGQTLALGRDDGQLLLRARGTNGTWFAAHGGSVRALAFSPDGKLLLSAGDDQSLKLWRLTGDTEAKELLALGGHAQPVDSLAFSPDGATFASAGEDPSLRLWSRAALESFFAASPRALLIEAQQAMALNPTPALDPAARTSVP